MANHVRFIDDHCVDSEEIRTEMQKDIDRLVAQLEDQEKQNRTTSNLQTQVQRLEGNFWKKNIFDQKSADFQVDFDSKIFLTKYPLFLNIHF